MLPRVEPPPLPTWETAGAFEEVSEGPTPDLASHFLVVEGEIFLFDEKRWEVKTNNEWEFAQCISGPSAHFLHLRILQGTFLSRLRLRILITTEPLHQSSLVRHLINLELPAPPLRLQMSVLKPPWALIISMEHTFSVLFFPTLFFSPFSSRLFPKCLSLLQKSRFSQALAVKWIS